MKSLLIQQESWFNGTCSVCGSDTRVIKFLTDRKMIMKVEFQIVLCSDCAMYTAGTLLSAWGYVPRDGNKG